MKLEIISYKFPFFKENDMLTCEEKEILFDDGIPIVDTDYHTFFPTEQLRVIFIENEQFIILGSPSGFSFQDNVIVLCLKTKKVYYYCKPLYDIGYYKSILSTVNSNLSFFVFFQNSIAMFSQKLREASINDFEIIKNEFFLLKKNLAERDSFGFNLKATEWDKVSYWDKRFFELEHECEEKFDAFF